MVEALVAERQRHRVGKKTHLLRHCYTQNDHFTKTGSGQTWGTQHSKKRRVFSGGPGVAHEWLKADKLQVRRINALFAPHLCSPILYLETIIFTKTGSGQKT